METNNKNVNPAKVLEILDSSKEFKKMKNYKENDKKIEYEKNDKEQEIEQETEIPKLNPFLKFLKDIKNEDLKNLLEIIENNNQDSFYKHFLLDTAGYIPENISLEDYLKVKEYLNQNKQYSIDDAKEILKTILALEEYNKSYNFCNDIEQNRINRKAETILIYLFNNDFVKKCSLKNEILNNKELEKYKEKIIKELEIRKLNYRPVLTKDNKVVFVKRKDIENFLLKNRKSLRKMILDNKDINFIKSLMSLETFVTGITKELNKLKEKSNKLSEKINEIEKEQDITDKVKKILNYQEFNHIVNNFLLKYIEEKDLLVFKTDSYILRNKYHKGEKSSHKILELKNFSIGVFLPEEKKMKEFNKDKIESIFISPYVNYRESKDEISNNNFDINEENNFINYLKSQFDISKEFIEPKKFDTFKEKNNDNNEEENNNKKEYDEELDYFLKNKKFQRFTAYQKLRELLHQGILGPKLRNKEIIFFLKEHNMGNLILNMSKKDLNLKKYFIDNLIDQYDVFDVNEKISTDIFDIISKDEKEKVFIQNEIKGYLNNINRLNENKEEIFNKFISQETKFFKFLKDSIIEKSYQDFINYLLINKNIQQEEKIKYESNLYNMYNILKNNESFFNSFEENYAKLLEYYEEYNKIITNEKEKNKTNISNFTEFLINKIKEDFADKSNRQISNFLMLIVTLGTEKTNRQELENMFSNIKKINNINELDNYDFNINNEKISFLITNKDYLNTLYEKVKKLKENLNKFYFIEKNKYSEITFEKTLNEFLKNISFNFHRFSDVYNKINNNIYLERNENKSKKGIEIEIENVFDSLQNILQQDFYVPFDLIYEDSNRIFLKDIIQEYDLKNPKDVKKVKEIFEIFFNKLASVDFEKIIEQYKKQLEQKEDKTEKEQIILNLIDSLDKEKDDSKKETLLNHLKEELIEYEIELLKNKKSSILLNEENKETKNILNNIIFNNSANDIDNLIFKTKIINSFYEKEIENGLLVKKILLKNIELKKLNDSIDIEDVEKIKPVLIDNLNNLIKEEKEENDKNNFILDKIVEIADNINLQEIKGKEDLIEQIKKIKENMDKGKFTLKNFINLYMINNLYKIAIQEYDNSFLEKEEKTNLENSLKNEIYLLLNLKISKRMEEKYPKNENLKNGTIDIFEKIQYLFEEKEEYYKKIMDNQLKLLNIIYERKKTDTLPNSLKEDDEINNFLLEIKSYLKNKELTIKHERNNNRIQRMNIFQKTFLRKELNSLKDEISLNNKNKIEETEKYLNLLAKDYKNMDEKLNNNTELFSKITNDYLYRGRKHIEQADKYKQKITEFLTREKKELIPLPFKEIDPKIGEVKKVNVFFERDELEKAFKHLKINNKIPFKEQINEFLKNYQNQLDTSNIEISEDGFSKKIKIISKDNQIIEIKTAEMTENQKKRLDQAIDKKLLNNLEKDNFTDNWQQTVKKHKDDLILLTYWEEDYKQNYQLLADKKQSLFERYQNNLERKLNEIPSYRGGLQSYMTRVFFPFLAIFDALQAIAAYIEEDLKYQKEKDLYLSQIEKNMLQSKRELNKNIEKAINSKKKIVNEVNKLNEILTRSQNINDLIIELYKEKDNSSLIKSLFLLNDRGEIEDCSEIQRPEYCKKAVIYKKNGKLIFNNENFQKRINEINDILNGSFMQDNSYKKIFSLNLILERLQTEFVDQNSKIKLLGTNWGGIENFFLSYNKRESMIIDQDLNVINNYINPAYSRTFSLKKMINSPKALFEILTDQEKTNNLLSYLDKEEKNKVLKMIDEIISKKMFDLIEKKQSNFNELVKLSKNEFDLKRIFNEPISKIILLKNENEQKKINLKTTPENKNLFEHFLAERNNISTKEVIDKSIDELEVEFPNIYDLTNEEFLNNNKKQIISTFKNLNLSFISENIEKESLEKLNDEKILNFLKNGNIKDLISDLNLNKKETKKIEKELKKNKDKILQIIFDSLNLSNKKTFKIKELKQDLNNLKITENLKNKKNNIFSLIEEINLLLSDIYLNNHLDSKKMLKKTNILLEQINQIKPKTSKERKIIQFLNDIKILMEKANNPKEYQELLKVLSLNDEEKTKLFYLKDLIENSNFKDTIKNELLNLNKTDEIIKRLQTINNLSAKKILNKIDNFSILNLYNEKPELLVYKIDPKNNLENINSFEYFRKYIENKKSLLNNYEDFLKSNISDYMDRKKFIKKYSITPEEANKLIEQSKKFIISKIKKQIDTEKILEQNKNDVFINNSINKIYNFLNNDKEEKANSLIQTTKFLELINKQTKDKEIIEQLNKKITYFNKNPNFINNEIEIDPTIQRIIDQTKEQNENRPERNVKIKGIEI